MQKVFITGITGFAGSHLADYLVHLGKAEISGTYLTESSKNNLPIQGAVNLIQLDLQDEAKTSEVIRNLKPDKIFHLAALAAPGDSFANPKETILNNIVSQLNVLEAVRKNNLSKTKFLVVSSADVYGVVSKKDLPIDEETPFNPTNPYALSKLTQDYLGLQYFKSYKLPIIRVRPFNHIGTRQSPNFAIPTFAKKIAEIEKGKIPPVLKVGTLETKRDFTDVRDVVRAYDLVLDKGTAGEVYNIGSGDSLKLSDILDKLIQFSTAKITVETDPSLLRPVDTPELVCDNRKIVKTTGWGPQIPLEQTLKEVLEYWRNQV